jgi:hypothetical protein
MDTDFLVLRAPANGTARDPFPYAPPEARILADGSVFNVYLALQYHGYWIEIADSIVVGEPRAAHADGVSIVQAYLQEVLDESVVSAPPSDGRYLWIHGIGLDRDEPPFTSRLNQPDGAGDVIGVHVAIERDGALFVCGRSVAVVGRERRVLA